MKIDPFKKDKWLFCMTKIKRIFEKRTIIYRKIKTAGRTMSSCSPYLLRTKQEKIGLL